MKSEEKKLELKDPIIHQTNENCQVFNGPISGCVFAMPGSTVNQSPVQQVDSKEQNKGLTLNYSEQKIKTAIEKIMDTQDDQKEYIFKDQDQWYAVFRVLSTYCGYPTKKTDFESVMKNIGCADLRVACRYESFRKVTLNNLPKNLNLWRQFEKTADQYSKKFLVVALKLMEILDIKE